MAAFSLENQGAETFLLCRLDSGEQVDNPARKMLENNNVKGIFRPQLMQRDEDISFKYQVTSKIPVREFYGSEMKREDVLRILSGVSGTLRDAKGYMLEEDHFMLDSEHIYVDVHNYETSLIYLPVIEYKCQHTLRGFVLELLSSIQYDLKGDVRFVAEIISFVNRASYLPAKAMYAELRRIREEVAMESLHRGNAPQGSFRQGSPGGSGSLPQGSLSQSNAQQEDGSGGAKFQETGAGSQAMQLPESGAQPAAAGAFASVGGGSEGAEPGAVTPAAAYAGSASAPGDAFGAYGDVEEIPATVMLTEDSEPESEPMGDAFGLGRGGSMDPDDMGTVMLGEEEASHLPDPYGVLQQTGQQDPFGQVGSPMDPFGQSGSSMDSFGQPGGFVGQPGGAADWSGGTGSQSSVTVPWQAGPSVSDIPSYGPTIPVESSFGETVPAGRGDMGGAEDRPTEYVPEEMGATVAFQEGMEPWQAQGGAYGSLDSFGGYSANAGVPGGPGGVPGQVQSGAYDQMGNAYSGGTAALYGSAGSMGGSAEQPQKKPGLFERLFGKKKKSDAVPDPQNLYGGQGGYPAYGNPGPYGNHPGAYGNPGGVPPYGNGNAQYGNPGNAQYGNVGNPGAAGNFGNVGNAPYGNQSAYGNPPYGNGGGNVPYGNSPYGNIGNVGNASHGEQNAYGNLGSSESQGNPGNAGASPSYGASDGNVSYGAAGASGTLDAPDASGALGISGASETSAAPNAPNVSFGDYGMSGQWSAGGAGSTQDPGVPPVQGDGGNVYLGNGSNAGDDDEDKTVILGGDDQDYHQTVVLSGEEAPVGGDEGFSLRMAMLTRQRNGQSMMINKEVYRIGSSANVVDFYVGDNPSVSPLHADIVQLENGEYAVSDKNSPAHTFVNGEMVPAGVRKPLQSGDVLRLGDEEFTFVVR